MSLVPYLAPLAALGTLGVAVGGAFLGLALASAGQPMAVFIDDPYLWRVIRFTLVQAGLSTLLAMALAIRLARALARQGVFPGRAMLLRLFALPPVLPALIAVLGIVAVWGGNGWINRTLDAAGAGARLPLYGLTGILIAHVFFNLPLATRFLLQAWQAIPGETWRLAAQLGMDSRAIFRQIEFPLIRRHAPGLAGFVFLLCVLSFTTVLTLGGGPAATTIEVAIYQALRFDFAPERAAMLALVQLALCLCLLMGWHSLAAPMPMGGTLARPSLRPDRRDFASLAGDAAIIIAAALFVLAPLVAVALAGIGPELPRLLAEAAVWRAIGMSLSIAVLAAVLASLLAVGLLVGARQLRRRARTRRFAAPLVSAGLIGLAVPPFVIGAGWFVLLYRIADPLALGLPAVIAINALMGLPYIMRALDSALIDLDERYDRLAASLGLAGWSRFRLIDWHHLGRPFALALGFCAALSLGDLGVIALFGGRDTATLPLILYQRMGAYRLDEAAALALLLALLCLAVFALTEIMGRRHDGR